MPGSHLFEATPDSTDNEPAVDSTALDCGLALLAKLEAEEKLDLLAAEEHRERPPAPAAGAETPRFPAVELLLDSPVAGAPSPPEATAANRGWPTPGTNNSKGR
mmetsp:Transcript_82182/g.229088  ORF Transcript_82182/g.229088 Transcript_82182/m.229088 type:complete len:104 (-) Transcript_82182:142-453(-)